MDSLNQENQADVIEAFNSTSRYLDDLLNFDTAGNVVRGKHMLCKRTPYGSVQT